MRRALALACCALAVGAAPARAVVGVPPPRLDTLADELRAGPLAVDPDLAYLLTDRQRDRLLEQLRATPFPFHVALLPALDEDESGGDQYRQLRGLAARVDERGAYVVVDQDGEIQVALVDVGRALSVPYELQDGRARTLGEAPSEVTDDSVGTVPERLRTIVRRVSTAPADTAEAFVTTAYERPADDDGGDDPEWPLYVFAAVMGLLAATVLYWLSRLVIRIAEAIRA